MFSINGFGKTTYSHAKKYETGTLSYTIQKNNKEKYRLKCKIGKYKNPRRKHMKMLLHNDLDNDSDITTKA